MLGAIAGDIIGAPFEHARAKSIDFPLFSPESKFTDDTVLTIAVADAILYKKSYADAFREYYERYPQAGFGAGFKKWAQADAGTTSDSYGNGSAMRVSPIAYAFASLDDVLEEAKRSALDTHSHPEGVKGAQAIAGATFLAKTEASKSEIRAFIETTFSYDLSKTLEEIKRSYLYSGFDATCKKTVPEAITAFLDSEDFEDAIRRAVYMGGDADTMACMAGSIAEPFYQGVPEAIAQSALEKLDQPMRKCLAEFKQAYPIQY